MSNIIDLVTVGEKGVLIVDADPSSGGGTPATLGTLAIYDSGSTATMYIKNGTLDTAWDLFGTAGGAGTVSTGVAGRVALYPTSSNNVDDVYVQNSQNIDILIAAQGSRSAAIEYTIPNPGDAITAASFVLTEGAQNINGDKTFVDNVVVSGNLSVNGTLTSVATTNTTIKDKLITLNKGGGIGSASGSGIEFEEAVQATSTSAGANAGSIFTATAVGPLGNGIVVTVTDSGSGAVLVTQGSGTVSINLQGNASASQATLLSAGMTSVTLNGVDIIDPEVFPATSGGIGSITGYMKTDSSRDSFNFKAPTTFELEMDLALLAADRKVQFQDLAGTVALQVGTAALTAGSMLFAGTTGLVSQNNANIFWDITNARLGLGTVSPSVQLHTTGGIRFASLSSAGIVHNDANGVLSTSAISLTADVTGVLPLANGGSNANLSAVAGAVVYSSASAMVMSAAGTTGQALISGGTGAPTWFASSGVVHATSGVLSTSAVVLTSEVSGVLPVANGGTNSSTALTGKQIMVSNSGATAIVEAGAMTDGQLLIGSTGAQPVIAAIVQSSANQVVVVNGAGSITLSLPQNIHSGATPTFAGELLSGAGAYLEINDTTASADMKITMATVDTTTGTTATLATVATTTDTVMLLEVKITGLRTGGSAGTVGDSASYIRTARVKNIAGTVTIMSLQSDFTSEDQTAFNGTLTVSSTNILVRVTGATNNNITWKAVITKIL